MSDSTSDFIHRWLFDVDAILLRILERLKDDLGSDDKTTRITASRIAGEAFDWLYTPLSKPTDNEKIERIQEVLSDKRLSAASRLRAAQRVIRSGGRRRGRPRTETSQQAIEALKLHYSTEETWPEIAFRIKGCAHRGPRTKDHSCAACAAATLNAARRLENFLKRCGMTPPKDVKTQRNPSPRKKQ